MKKQSLISETEVAAFNSEVNKVLHAGHSIVPGCIYATSMLSNMHKLFAVTVWKNGVQTMLTATDFKVFSKNVNNFLSHGYFIVVGSLYATATGIDDGYNGVPETEQFFFNVLGEY